MAGNWQSTLGSRNYSFSADVDRIVANTDKRLDFVMKQSLVDTINEMQKVGASVAATKAAIKEGLGSSGRGKKRKFVQGPVAAPGEGGRMRVDTGFLRATGQVSFNGMPTGPSQKPKDAAAGSYKWDGASVDIQIKTSEIGATIFWGWTASYAKYREAYDGFMYAAIQNWQQTVNRVTEDAKRRFS